VIEIAFADMIHGFLNMGAALPQAGDAVDCVAAALQALLTSRPRAPHAPQRFGASIAADVAG
jgi:hypothetical protein